MMARTLLFLLVAGSLSLMAACSDNPAGTLFSPVFNLDSGDGAALVQQGDSTTTSDPGDGSDPLVEGSDTTTVGDGGTGEPTDTTTSTTAPTDTTTSTTAPTDTTTSTTTPTDTTTSTVAPTDTTTTTVAPTDTTTTAVAPTDSTRYVYEPLVCEQKATSTYSTLVTPESGGSLKVRHHSVRVPPGAVPDTVTLTMRVAASPYVEIHLMVNCDHYQFLKPVTIEISYHRCEVDYSTAELSSWYFKDLVTKKLLGNMGGVHRRDKKLIEFLTDHFTGFMIVNRM
jgi:hypothetical protein